MKYIILGIVVAVFVIFITCFFLVYYKELYSVDDFVNGPFSANVYFVKPKSKLDSSKMRCDDIVDGLGDRKINAKVITLDEVKNYYKHESNAVFIWLGPGGNEHIPRFQHENFHILDCIDKYVLDKNKIEFGLKSNLYNKVIVNNESMKKHFQKMSCSDVTVIHHHSDPRYEKVITSVPKNVLKFGYIGSILSLFHSDNFMYFQKLASLYDIQFYDTEFGQDVTKYVQENKNQNALLDILKSKPNASVPQNLNFNCDISIRPYGSDLAKFKTTSKVATAAILGHNIITTFDDSVKDVLPSNYPFLLKNTDYKNIKAMFETVKKDFYGEKKLWKMGLKMMREAKQKLTFNKILTNYLEALQKSITTFEIMGVYSVGCVGELYTEIVMEQLNLLKQSKLYHNMKSMHVFLGNYDSEKDKHLLLFLRSYDTSKKITVHITEENRREKFAIDSFRDYIKDEKYIFYIHSKGVTHKNGSINHDWRRVLNFYTINKWVLNVNLLRTYDAVGCYLSLYPSIHFSGNFWWATSKYVKTLPKKCGNYYLSPEMWIGLGNGNLISVSNTDRYSPFYHQSLSNIQILNNLTKSHIVINGNKYVRF